MPTKVLGDLAKLPAVSAALLFLLFSISCGSSNNTNVVCNLPSASSSTCVCPSSGVAGCPAILNEYLYTTGSSGQVLEFDISTETGVLSNLNSTATGPSSTGLAYVNDQFVYISDPSHAQLDGFSFTQTGGLATLAGSPFSIGSSSVPQGLASPPNGSVFLYAADNGAVDALSVSTSGVPTPITGSPFPSGTNSYLATDADAEFVFTSIDDPPGGIFGFTIGPTGALTEIPGSPFAIPGQTVANSQPAGIVANVNNVYAALTGSNQIAAFTITTGTGVLTPVANSPFPAGTGPTALALNDTFLYAINSADSTISGYSVDSSTGALIPLANSPFSIAGNGLSFDFTKQYLYVSGASGIQAFAIDSSTGNLTPIPGSPFAASDVLSLIVVPE
jgi:6-phosphogluconolactonase